MAYFLLMSCCFGQTQNKYKNFDLLIQSSPRSANYTKYVGKADFFNLNESLILYLVFTVIIVVSSLGFKSFITSSISNNLENRNRDNNRKLFVNFFVYFLLFFLIMLTIGVTKNLLFDTPSSLSL